MLKYSTCILCFRTAIFQNFMYSTYSKNLTHSMYLSFQNTFKKFKITFFCFLVKNNLKLKKYSTQILSISRILQIKYVFYEFFKKSSNT